MLRGIIVVLLSSAASLGFAILAHADDSAPKPALVWHGDYQQAWDQARDEKKQLLLFFTAPQATQTRLMVEEAFRTDAKLQEQLAEFVLVKLPTDAVASVQGEPVTLLKHGAFRELHGREGLAVIDLAHKGEEFYNHVVSAFPFMRGKYYELKREHLSAVLDLPPGTITQRTMIWAVRVHPEKPASTRGTRSTTLFREARSHSQHQANIGVQGHHQWGSRFQRILRLLSGGGGGGRAPVEVVAESWPNQTMIDSCIDCVASWRHSPGHWNAVKSYQAVYGYDIQRGSNGIWYGTGIFAN